MASYKCADRISKLPQDVVDAILMRMPIRDAVRTSVLSKCWRHKWTTIPDLEFIETDFTIAREFPMIIYRVFLQHPGPVRRFQLYFDTRDPDMNSFIDSWNKFDLNIWIRFASRMGIKELVLDIPFGNYYKLPTCLFSCETITYLYLLKCEFIPPDSFVGFKNLKRLALNMCVVNFNVMEKLLSNDLEKFMFDGHCEEEVHFTIRAPKLVELAINSGGLLYPRLENAPVLAIASIELDSKKTSRNIKATTHYNFTDALGSLPSLQDLKLLGDTLQVITRYEIPSSISIMKNLQKLVIEVNFEDARQVLAALLLMKSSPRLSKLHVLASSKTKKIGSKTSLLNLEEQEEFISLLNSLCVVKMTGFMGINNEYKFIKYLLASAPILDKLEIQMKPKVAFDFGMAKQLIRFKRRSANAEVVISRQ